MKHPLRYILSLATLTAGAITMLGAELSPDAALARALDNSRHRLPAKSATYKLSKTISRVDNSAASLYVFSNTNKGFIVTTADDRLPAVLGYSDAAFEADNIPPALEWWLSEYAIQAEHVLSQPQQEKAPVFRVQRNNIAPLVHSTWDQGDPYNLQCPSWDGKHSVTGCIATAMAQVMNYHEWPNKGVGSNSYSTTYNNQSQTVSLNFGESSFDWDNMLDDYSEDASTEQKNAVAQLMYACGVASNMAYGLSASSSTIYDCHKAMISYFNYDKGIRLYPRNYYGINDWEDLIYGQLKDYGPVIYTGVNSTIGHAFICDGYRDGYFHFNWGWSGISDGYFLLNLLDPAEQGIGGSFDGYNLSQNIIGNICKPQEGSKEYPTLALLDKFELSATTVTAGDNIDIKSSMCSFSLTPFTVYPGLKYTSTLGESVYSAKYACANNLPYNSFFANVPTPTPTDLADGTYIVTPAYQVDDIWYDMPTLISDVQSYILNVSGTTLTFAPESTKARLLVSNTTMLSEVYLGMPFSFSTTISNIGDKEFYGSFTALFCTAGTNNLVAIGDDCAINLIPNESIDINYVSKSFRVFQGEELVAGDYDMYLFNYDKLTVFSQPISVTIKEPVATTISISNLTLEGDNNNADYNGLNFKANISCLKGYFADQLTLAIFKYPEGGSSLITSKSNYIFLNADETKEAKFFVKFSQAELGGKYMAYIFYNGTQQKDGVIFTVSSEQTGIDSPTSNDCIVSPTITDGLVNIAPLAKAVTVYNLNGTAILNDGETDCIDISSFAPGMYFLDITTHDGKRSVKRIVKR